MEYQEFQHGRIPSLDGLRAISIAMVLVAHAAGTRFTPSLIHLRGPLGNLGVRIFFLISGFLITTLLLQEWTTTRGLSLGRFYLRRAFRIFPCAFTYIAAIAFLAWIGWCDLGANALIHALTYTVNYEPLRPWSTTHLWSLSIEEQFYLIWPVVLWLFGSQRAIRISAAAVFLVPLIRLLTWYCIPSWQWSISSAFQTTADSLATGCLLASLRPWLSQQQAYLRFMHSKAFVVVPIVGFLSVLAAAAPGLQVLTFALGLTVLNFSIGLSIDWAIRNASNPLGSFLNSPLMVFVGVLSYSLYLWQQPFLNRLGTHGIQSFPLNVTLAFVAAMVSHYIIERPFMSARRRIENRLWRKERRVKHMHSFDAASAGS